MRYAGDHAAWHKHIHNVTLDPVQVLKCLEMDRHLNTIDFSCRRTGKTFIKELWCLKHLACNPGEQEGIVAPRMQQSLTNMGYHVDAIRRSPILLAYIATKNGRSQLRDGDYQLVNGSGASAYGIMGQIDGDSLTIASLEETDDMPYDRLTSRFLPMLGAARRAGLDREVMPKVRITGVFKGADVLSSLIDSGAYQVLPIVDVNLALELGLVNRAWADDMRTQNTEGEWIRQFLCRNMSSQNFIWESYILKAKAVGLQAGLDIAGPLPGHRYRKRGILSFGYDHTGHGESPTASKSALVVAEQIGAFVTFPFVRNWDPGTDDRVIERDLYALWDYFRPDVALGDAYGVGMLSGLNDRLYREGLISVDRATVGNGQSSASSWPEWAFAPIRFEGMTKHSMAAQLKMLFHNGYAAIPWWDSDQPGFDDWTLFVRQLANMKQVPTQASYSSFQMADTKLGDDYFDAAMAAVWAMYRLCEEHTSVILTRRSSREDLLGRDPGRTAWITQE